MNKRISKLLLLIVVVGLLALMAPGVGEAAQAPTPDSYEENDTLIEAAAIPVGANLNNLSISPANDPDWFRVLVSPPPAYPYPGQYRLEVIATPGIDLTLTLYDGTAALLATANDPTSPNATISFSASLESYYAIEVTETSGNEGWYVLRLLDLTPAPTPTATSTAIPTSTPTLLPTATSPFPTATATPALGGQPDIAEPNYDFASAYRLVPGDLLANLNFNSGTPERVDNDFFVMATRADVAYTCETRELGPAADTNLILYAAADSSQLIGGNDDIDTQAGLINSRVAFTATSDGDVYLLVGYKFPELVDLAYPGAATYSLTCFSGTPQPSGGGGLPSGFPQHATPLSIRALLQPNLLPTPTPIPIVPQTIDVLVGYDRNDNGQLDPSEGVQGLSVRVVEASANRQLSHGLTGPGGSVRFVLASGVPIRVVIPFLGAAEDFRPGSPVQWTLLIPASNAPGLIP